MAARALGRRVMVVPESRIAGWLKSDGVRVSTPEEDEATRDVKSTVNELMLPPGAEGCTSTEMRSP